MPRYRPSCRRERARGPALDEQTLRHNAEENNRSVVSLLRSEGLLADESFGGLPQSIYNDAMLRDAWGSPIVFMPSMHPGIGMAPQDKPFFFSAGPDQRYLTQENNFTAMRSRGDGVTG